MASISTTRAAIQAAITAMPLRCYDFAPSNLNTPCAVVGFPTKYNPNDTFGDTASFTIPVSVYVGYGSTRAAEDALEAYLSTSGATSLIATIEALGGNYQISAVRDFGVLENNNAQPVALGCVIDVEVFV